MEHRQFLQSCREILPTRRPFSGPPDAIETRGVSPALPMADPALERVLVILPPVPPDGNGSGVADAYVEGARSAGAEVRELHLGGPHPAEPSLSTSSSEPGTDLEEARRLLAWCQHLVLVHPEGREGLPSNLSAILDRCLLPGFAYLENDGRRLPLLGGRTAEVITGPQARGRRRRWIRWTPRTRVPGHFESSGIETVRVTRLEPAGSSPGSEPAEWITAADELGRRLRKGARSSAQTLVRSATSWLDASRPPLHILAVLAYVVGTLGAQSSGGAVQPLAFVAGVVVVLAVMTAAAFVNELCDYESDVRNANWSAFSGGSRVLVDGRLRRSDLRYGAKLALAISALAAVALIRTTTGSPMAVGVVGVMMAVVAVGHSLPPLQLSRRAFGEIVFSLTAGVSLVLLGYLAQGGAWTEAFPWMMGLLIGISVIPALLLSGLPDRGADRAAGKRTLAVRLGPSRAAGFALAALLLACLLAAASTEWTALAGATRGLPYVAVPHAILIMLGLVRHLDAGAPEQRLDGLLAGALLFPVWFVVLPLMHLH